jgi:hypothetical protein
MGWGLQSAHLKFLICDASRHKSRQNLDNFPLQRSIANECVVAAFIMECNVDLLILNVLRNVSPCQIETGGAGKRYSAAVCKTNEPYPLPRPVFCP